MSEDWAQVQTHCPQGHEAVWPNATRSYEACPECPCVSDGRGHFSLRCEACKARYWPPGCTLPAEWAALVERGPRGGLGPDTERAE